MTATRLNPLMNQILQRLSACLSVLFTLSFSEIAAEGFPPFGIDDPVGPLPGSLILTGDQIPSELARKTLAQLGDGREGTLVLIVREENQDEVAQWGRFVGEVRSYAIKTDQDAVSAELVTAIRGASGVWLADDFSQMQDTKLHDVLLETFLQGGVIGGGGRAAESLGETIKIGSASAPALGFLPESVIKTGAAGEEGAEKPSPYVTWQIPSTGVLVFHSGREVGVLGETEVTARIPAQNGWPERIETLRPPEVRLPYSADLFSWTRSAQARRGPVFPAKDPVSPEVAEGALILIGGGGSTQDMWTRFIEEAGGPGANYVCIIQQESPFPEMNLRRLGCDNVTVLLSDIELRHQANHDEDFLSALRTADGIFFGGGRTYRFMDTYQNTTAHALMLDVLKRGGVIAGTSAGAQIQGDFLVRGDPRTNETIWMLGNDVGLSFLRGVIIDVHFLNRGREKTFPPLLQKHPKMLGIGIDEATAIVVKGTTAAVLGRGAVSFYDIANDAPSEAPKPIILKAGSSYDLKTRSPIPES